MVDVILMPDHIGESTIPQLQQLLACGYVKIHANELIGAGSSCVLYTNTRHQAHAPTFEASRRVAICNYRRAVIDEVNIVGLFAKMAQCNCRAYKQVCFDMGKLQQYRTLKRFRRNRH